MTKGPLRKIVRVVHHADSIYGKQRVELECGHEVSVSSGAIYKGRCRWCKKETEQKA
jgi:hypothetical protein